MKYRMYIDEVGNSDLQASKNPNHRYLSLTGLIFELDYVASTMFPAVERLKLAHFGSHPDEPVILHRREVMQRKQPFDSLRDDTANDAFLKELLALFRTLDYVVVTAVIDKLQHLERYKVWRSDPYHYCLTVLIERFVQWLEHQNAVGDVMAESRGAKEDMRLKREFTQIYTGGTDFLVPKLVQARLTSKELKVKPKAQNVAGLQLADLMAYPSYRTALCRHERKPLPLDVNGQVGQILEDSKYDRSPSGRIDGWGRKWLP
jgi:Protein of unknown function (DUF3800)